MSPKIRHLKVSIAFYGRQEQDLRRCAVSLRVRDPAVCETIGGATDDIGFNSVRFWDLS